MKIPKRVPLSRLTANSLEKEILNKRWTHQLPGYRDLCKDLQVSRKTLVAALKILTRRKILLPPHGTRARVINTQYITGNKAKPSRKRRILLTIANPSIYDLAHKTRNTMSIIRSNLREKGWTCRHIHNEEVGQKPGEKLTMLHEQYPQSRWLLHMPSYETVKWCTKNNIRIVAYGSAFYRKSVSCPTVSASLSSVMIQAHEALSSFGHRRIVTLIHQPPLVTQRKYERYLNTQGIVYRKEYHLPDLTGATPEKTHQLLENLFSVTPPTAIILSQSKYLTCLLGFCMQRGLRIPNDLSVILTNDLPDKEWFLPQISYFERNYDREVKKLTEYIEHYPVHPVKPEVIPMKLFNKSSITRPRA